MNDSKVSMRILSGLSVRAKNPKRAKGTSQNSYRTFTLQSWKTEHWWNEKMCLHDLQSTKTTACQGNGSHQPPQNARNLVGF